MRSLLFVALVLVGCGEDNQEAVTKAVEAAQTNPETGAITDGTCPSTDVYGEPETVCDR